MKLQRQPLQTVCLAAEGDEEEIGEATVTLAAVKISMNAGLAGVSSELDAFNKKMALKAFHFSKWFW